eukprot:snap_masked-scaffold_6-processed-gene-7.32-mRNA-1 protein AED:1.00 eAED:1.00 QI:0/0/0/0/1/1/2/0/143
MSRSAYADRELSRFLRGDYEIYGIDISYHVDIMFFILPNVLAPNKLKDLWETELHFVHLDLNNLRVEVLNVLGSEELILQKVDLTKFYLSSANASYYLYHSLFLSSGAAILCITVITVDKTLNKASCGKENFHSICMWKVIDR